eukprot:COSAG01_NODE_7039_length_3381_cov_3.333943_1_plen_339_part_00
MLHRCSLRLRPSAPLVRALLSRIWPLSKRSAATWAAICAVLYGKWLKTFVHWGETGTVKQEKAKERKRLGELMGAILRYADAERLKVNDARPGPARSQTCPRSRTPPPSLSLRQPATTVSKARHMLWLCALMVCSHWLSPITQPAESRKMPEAKRVYSLLWDETFTCKVKRYGIKSDAEDFLRTEQLLRETLRAELEKCVSLTRRAREARLKSNGAGAATAGVSAAAAPATSDGKGDEDGEGGARCSAACTHHHVCCIHAERVGGALSARVVSIRADLRATTHARCRPGACRGGSGGAQGAGRARERREAQEHGGQFCGLCQPAAGSRSITPTGYGGA